MMAGVFLLIFEMPHIFHAREGVRRSMNLRTAWKQPSTTEIRVLHSMRGEGRPFAGRHIY